jgi:hypothetical protein
MTDLKELQNKITGLQQKLAEETLAQAAKQRELVLQRAMAREAEVTKALKEIAGLMLKYQLKKEHLLKAAQQSGVLSDAYDIYASTEHGAKGSQVGTDGKFDVAQSPHSSAPAKSRSLAAMRQFYKN